MVTSGNLIFTCFFSAVLGPPAGQKWANFLEKQISSGPDPHECLCHAGSQMVLKP